MLEEIAQVALRLRAIGIEGVFVGGATLSAMVTDVAAPPPRFTDDVDLVVPSDTKVKYYKLEEKLRSAGHTQPGGDAPICRWLIGGISVDLMPPIDDVLGFSNRWYRSVLETARTILIGTTPVQIVDAPHLLACKLEAYFDRGHSDPLASRDLTDIVVLVDGRPELSDEIMDAKIELRQFVSSSLTRLMLNDLEYYLPAHLYPDATSQARVEVILERIRQIIDQNGNL